MPWNSMGEWVNPEGWEDYDVDELFSEVTSSEEGMSNVIGELTGAAGDSLATIMEGLSPYDFREESQIKRQADTSRKGLRESVFAQSTDINKMIGKSGFSSTYSGGVQIGNLWSDYLNKMKEITKSKSQSLYQSRADYLDRLWSEAVMVEDIVEGDG
tara:strand:+ start:1937 stop:2407 length:471 start_codon:yes stop_codon:yes gene_type:complete